jgi:predicted O-methyltransferase YrrM
VILTQEQVDEFAGEEHRESPGYSKELGGYLFRKRQKFLAELAVKSCPGDLIEIGVLSGDTSVLLADVARRYNRKLVCIDNWPTEGIAAPYRLDLAEEAFYKTMEPYKDVYELWRVDAHDPETLKRIGSRQWCYALSDDGHLYSEHLAELCALLPVTTGIVVADDVYYHNDVKDAMRDAAAKTSGWRILHAENLQLREGYLVKT